MPLIACGLNHKTAPIALREQFSVVPEALADCLQQLHQHQQLPEVAILSTCNRTEYYYQAAHHQPVLEWLCDTHNCQQDEIQPYLYVHQEQQAVRHILRVASGLDSMVLGEPQILGQMKAAFASANEAGTIGPHLQRLFQYVFSVSKEVRTSTGIGTNPVSVAYAAVNLAKQALGELVGKSVMVVGAGETIELVLRYLREQGVSDVVVINRTVARAQKLAEQFQARSATFAEMAHCLSRMDIVITATGSTIPVLGKGTVERILKSRPDNPLFLVDLAVPRDIEPEVAELPGVHLYCVDDLQQVIQQSLQDRENAAQEAEKLIELQVEHYHRWLSSLDVVSVIRGFRQKIESMRDQEIRHAMQLLQQGSSAEEVCCHLARNLANKIMHTPTVKLRQAGYDDDVERLAMLNDLFDIS